MNLSWWEFCKHFSFLITFHPNNTTQANTSRNTSNSIHVWVNFGSLCVQKLLTVATFFIIQNFSYVIPWRTSQSLRSYGGELEYNLSIWWHWFYPCFQRLISLTSFRWSHSNHVLIILWNHCFLKNMSFKNWWNNNFRSKFVSRMSNILSALLQIHATSSCLSHY